MKNSVLFITAMFFATLISSCKKNETKASIVGKWKLTSSFYSYLGGGDNMWHDVADSISHNLHFTATGQYTRTHNGLGDDNDCSSTYTLSSADTLLINPPCYSSPQKKFVSELTATTLIIDHFGREGRMKLKYSFLP